MNRNVLIIVGLIVIAGLMYLLVGQKDKEVKIESVKLGIILGYTGPIESLTPDMAKGAELAISEVNEGGDFMNGTTITSVRADSTCIDSAAATAAAERLITSDKVNALVGADLSLIHI